MDRWSIFVCHPKFMLATALAANTIVETDTKEFYTESNRTCTVKENDDEQTGASDAGVQTIVYENGVAESYQNGGSAS
ncbi:hypothetical protein GCM10008022_15090 [Paenibacillus hunanensis]|nr:hypothetical protein GCM10008022_15090 [Paenibacillus hunanensis]